MRKGRLEAFSDGVFAIIITIMVLELKVPHDSELSSLESLLPVFLSYVLGFINVGLYWNNHHHLFQAVKKISGRVLWMNLLLLFWLSLFPFATAWMGENHFSTWPVALYGAIAFMAGVSYYLLVRSLMRLHSHDSTLATALGTDWKGKISVILYVIGIIVSFIHPFLGIITYVLVAGLWFIPDRRFENRLGNDD